MAFQTTSEPGTCTFCGGDAKPAFVNGTADHLGRLNRLCGACLAQFVALVGLAPIEQTRTLRQELKTVTATARRLEGELATAKAETEEAATLLEATKRRLADTEYQAQGLQAAVVGKENELRELRAGNVSLAAYAEEFAKAVAQVNGKTTKTREKVAA